MTLPEFYVIKDAKAHPLAPDVPLALPEVLTWVEGHFKRPWKLVQVVANYQDGFGNEEGLRRAIRIKIKVEKKGKPVYEEIDAESVVLPGFEDFQFAVHRSLDHGGTFTVSEVSTGSSIYQGADTAAQAITRAHERLKSRTTPERFKASADAELLKRKGKRA